MLSRVKKVGVLSIAFTAKKKRSFLTGKTRGVVLFAQVLEWMTCSQSSCGSCFRLCNHCSYFGKQQLTTWSKVKLAVWIVYKVFCLSRLVFISACLIISISHCMPAISPGYVISAPLFTYGMVALSLSVFEKNAALSSLLLSFQTKGTNGWVHGGSGTACSKRQLWRWKCLFACLVMHSLTWESIKHALNINMSVLTLRFVFILHDIAFSYDWNSQV